MNDMWSAAASVARGRFGYGANRNTSKSKPSPLSAHSKFAVFLRQQVLKRRLVDNSNAEFFGFIEFGTSFLAGNHVISFLAD